MLNATEMKLMENLNSNDPDIRYKTVRKIRNLLIGIKSKKTLFVVNGLIERLIDLLIEEDISIEFAVEAAVILGSLARGESDNLRRVLDSQAIPILCKGICHTDERLVNACLASLRICFMSNQVPADLIYEDANIVSHLVNLLSKNSQTAECTANILQRSCKTVSDQSMLYEAGILPALAIWLNHKQVAVLVPVFRCLSALVYCNEVISCKVLNGDVGGVNIKDLLIRLISCDNSDDIQLEAALCLTKALRAAHNKNLTKQLQRKILTVFVEMCVKEKPYKIRIAAADGLAYLIEEDSQLQTEASVSNHLIRNIAQYFLVSDDTDKETLENLRESGFNVFAALSANDEKIRKQIVDSSPDLISNIHEAINQETNVPLQAASLHCLLSLSRSVQQLRTIFQDVKLWEPVISALKSSTSDDIISVASSVFCNLLLHFSPCKESLVNCGALEVLVALMKRSEAPLRVNGVWGLMNLACDAEESLKNKIVEAVGIQNILSLLNDKNIDVSIKAVGILRNLTERQADIDNLMKEYGAQILAFVKHLIVDDALCDKLKEQVLCFISNIANGSYSGDILMTDEQILLKLISYITNDNEQLQMASVYCVSNLIRNASEFGSERRDKLKNLGVEKKLQGLLTTSSASLFDRVKSALNHFS